MHLGFVWHVAIMFFLSGLNYGAQATGVDGPRSRSSNPVADSAANNAATNGQQPDDDGDTLEQDLMALENAIGTLETTQASSEEYELALLNCSLPANLDRFCTDINAQDHAYFKFNLSVAGLLSSMFRDDIVKALVANCIPGSWCLPKYHQELMQGKSVFYSVHPICSDTLWTCLVIMLDERLDCKEKDLKYLMDSTYMLCNLEDGDDLGQECYARTLEALYVTLVGNIMHVAESQTTGSKQVDCNGYKAQMTKTFIRARDVCGTKQKALLNNFDSWEDIIQNHRSTSAVCNISNKAISSSTPYGDADSEEDEQLDKFLQEIENEIEGTEGTESGPQDGMNANANGAQQTDSKTMVIFAVVVTTVMAAAFLGLALLSYRRCRARCGYDKLGYSKLGEEEAALLRGEFT